MHFVYCLYDCLSDSILSVLYTRQNLIECLCEHVYGQTCFLRCIIFSKIWIDLTDFSQLYIILKYFSQGFRLRIHIWDYSSVCNDLYETIFPIEYDLYYRPLRDISFINGLHFSSANTDRLCMLPEMCYLVTFSESVIFAAT